MSIARLSRAREREQLRGRQADQRQALDRVDAARAARRPRTAAARCRSGRRCSRSVRMRSIVSSLGRARTRRRRARCRAARRKLGQIDRAGRAPGSPRGRDAWASGSASTKPSEVDAVLRMLDELAGDELADVAGTDDDVFCTYVLAAAGDRPGAGARDRDEDGSPSPRSATSLGRLGSASPVTDAPDEEEPGTERDELEDADEVVDRRVVGPLLVVVVELVELRHDDPERQRDDEQEDLHPDAHRAGSRIEAEQRARTRRTPARAPVHRRGSGAGRRATRAGAWAGTRGSPRETPASLPRCRREQRKQGRERAPALTPNGRP